MHKNCRKFWFWFIVYTSHVVLICSCEVERIEVGSRVKEARESGRLMPRGSMPALTSETTPEDLIRRAWKAAKQNLSDETVQTTLDQLPLEEPLRSDLIAYLRGIDPERVNLEELPIHFLEHIAEKHRLSLQNAPSLEELLRIGLAMQLKRPEVTAKLLQPATDSKLLLCTHKIETDVLMTAYAKDVVQDLLRRGYHCAPVALNR